MDRVNLRVSGAPDGGPSTGRVRQRSVMRVLREKLPARLQHAVGQAGGSACAKTLLASDIPGAREAITHDETGLLFRRADIDDLAEKTLLAAGNPALRARIGRQARQYVERHHDIDRAVDQYMALLQLQCER